jgi:hypothetical protein
MPLLYFNTGGVSNSEATFTLTELRDWTESGVAELSLWFRGGSDNGPDPLYIAVANPTGSSVIIPHEDANAALTLAWTKWSIPLQHFADRGIDLSDVDQLIIGLGSKSGMTTLGGIGTMYFDDIRLNRS